MMTLKLSKPVQKWELKYSSQENVFGTEPNNYLEEKLNHIKTCDGPILIPGDGDGRNGIWLAEQGLNIIANDGAPTGVKHANERAHQISSELKYTSQAIELTNWQPSKQLYDGVVLLHVHFETDERKVFYEKLDQSLKTDGFLLIEIFHPDNVDMAILGPKSKSLCATPQDLQTDFSNYKILESYRYEKQIKPTEFHDGGLGIVTRFFAHKN